MRAFVDSPSLAGLPSVRVDPRPRHGLGACGGARRARPPSARRPARERGAGRRHARAPRQVSVRYIGRENVRKRLAALEGTAGRTVYADGAATLVGAETLVVRPTFGLAHEGVYETVHVSPLLEAIAADHVVAVFLVRLGGYAIGVFEGEQLVASKVGSRFVKNRHKKGGSSANRFRRRREEQAKALVEEAAEVASTVLTPWRERVRVHGARRRPAGRRAGAGDARRPGVAARASDPALPGRARTAPPHARSAALRPLRGPGRRGVRHRTFLSGFWPDSARAEGSRGIRHGNERRT